MATKVPVKLIERPITTQWNVRISSSDYEKLKAGFLPQSSDDKYLIVAVEQPESGTMEVHVVRTGITREIWVLRVRVRLRSDNGQGMSDGDGRGHDDDDDDDDGAEIESLTYEEGFPSPNFTEDQVKAYLVMICRDRTGCAFDALPVYTTEYILPPKKDLLSPGARPTESTEPS